MQNLLILIIVLNLVEFLELKLLSLVFFQFEVVADREDTDIKQYFDECFNFVDEAKRLGGGVLVHCLVGRSRR